MPSTILIVDDEPHITDSFSALLGDEGYKTLSAATVDNALSVCRNNPINLVLLDLNLPGKSGVEFLRLLNEEPFQPSVLVISGQSDIPTALETLKLGAADYLEKPVSPERLIASVRATLMLAAAENQRRIHLDEIDANSTMIGSSPPVRKLFKTIAQVAPTDTTVLITGENGTGKELVATRLFLQSNRREKSFIKVNCPGIPSSLFESELFGHTKGAFTGAVRDYAGRFILADGGTLFLDEIGDLPLECQAKLLRVLESGEVERLGDSGTKQVDVRLICATNRNLPELILSDRFRQDLFYRISVFEINVPPLRKRPGDIPALAGSFLKRFDPSQSVRLTPEAMALLATQDYPGNVRQLRNTIERLTILFRDRTVGPAEIEGSELSLHSHSTDNYDSLSLNEKMRQYESTLISQTLKECDGNISQAARVLKVDRANLSRKIKELGIS